MQYARNVFHSIRFRPVDTIIPYQWYNNLTVNMVPYENTKKTERWEPSDDGERNILQTNE